MFFVINLKLKGAYLSRIDPFDTISLLNRLASDAASKSRHCRSNLTDPLVHLRQGSGRQINSTSLCNEKIKRKWKKPPVNIDWDLILHRSFGVYIQLRYDPSTGANNKRDLIELVNQRIFHISFYIYINNTKKKDRSLKKILVYIRRIIPFRRIDVSLSRYLQSWWPRRVAAGMILKSWHWTTILIGIAEHLWWWSRLLLHKCRNISNQCSGPSFPSKDRLKIPVDCCRRRASDHRVRNISSSTILIEGVPCHSTVGSVHCEGSKDQEQQERPLDKHSSSLLKDSENRQWRILTNRKSEKSIFKRE